MALFDKKRIQEMILLSRKAFAGYKLQIITIVVLGFLSGLFEAIGVNALIPVFSFVSGAGTGGDDIVSQVIEKFFAIFHITFSLKYLFIFICLLFVFKAIFIFVSDYVRIKIVADYEEKTRTRLLTKTFNADWPYLLTQKLGHLENILAVNVRNAAVFLQQVSTIIVVSTSLLMYVLVAINISMFVTFLTLGLGVVIFVIFKPLLAKTRLAGYNEAKGYENISHYVNENVLGIKTVKALSVGKKIIEQGERYFKDLKKQRIKIFLYSSISGSLLQPISLIFVCLLFAFSYKTPGFNIAAFAATIYLIQRIFQHIQLLQYDLYKINNTFPYLRGVLQFEDLAVKNQERDKGLDLFEFKKLLEFKNVDFSYNPDKKILSDINFSVRKGEMVGLIGPSGAGKTTVVDLMLRLFNVDDGKILLDGKDVTKIGTRDWRKNVGYVSQDIFLMNDTIANNIKFYQSNVSEEEMIRVAKMANIYDFIKDCSNGFETVIGERGVMLSAGQRQRIVIARILTRKPEFLILDEATSALDNESEMKIQDVIKNLKGNITVFVVAHRLSTIVDCDKIMVVDGGRIVEQGPPSELLKNNKTYFYKINNLRK